jgi:hypothetical protein
MNVAVERGIAKPRKPEAPTIGCSRHKNSVPMKSVVFLANAIVATSLAFWLVLSSVADRQQPSSSSSSLEELRAAAAAKAEPVSFESGKVWPAAGLDSSQQQARPTTTTTLHNNLRHRHLPGEDYGSNFTLDPSSAEAGFAVGFLFFIILVLLLCCCMCGGRGGGRGCSLCDILAIVCLWELCCDRDGGGLMDNGFNML